ncbi:hypothetical protein GGI17_006303 [Coemansia sp. S146]|nr:hypothetical protein GGI17_006303 [Coemansia sp. S146]
MQLMSPFKILPPHTIELIVDYVAGSSRLQFDGVSQGNKKYARLLIPLLDTCLSFRLSVFTHLFGIYYMRLPGILDNGSLPLQYAKKLDVSVGALDVCSGTLLNVLACEPYANCTFPSVRSIKLTYYLPMVLRQSADEIDSPETESNISAFVERIRQMAPTMTKIGVSLEFNRYNMLQLPVQPFSNLAAQLSQYTMDIKYWLGRQPAILDQRVSGLRSLVYSRSNLKDGGKQIMELARRSVSTLQLLDIDVDAIINITDLIQNADACNHSNTVVRKTLMCPNSQYFPAQCCFPDFGFWILEW